MYIVLRREDSVGEIYQSRFATEKEAREDYEKAKKSYSFCKLCLILETTN
jgi:hypothetical protein